MTGKITNLKVRLLKNTRLFRSVLGGPLILTQFILPVGTEITIEEDDLTAHYDHKEMQVIRITPSHRLPFSPVLVLTHEADYISMEALAKP